MYKTVFKVQGNILFADVSGERNYNDSRILWNLIKQQFDNPKIKNLILILNLDGIMSLLDYDKLATDPEIIKVIDGYNIALVDSNLLSIQNNQYAADLLYLKNIHVEVFQTVEKAKLWIASFS